MNQYDPKNIDKALKRMEKSDTLKGIHRSNTNIMSFFNDIEEDNPEQADEILNDVMRYASSSTKMSSQFIKIS